MYDLNNYFTAVDELTSWQAPKLVRVFIATDSNKVHIKSDKMMTVTGVALSTLTSVGC